MFLTRIFRQAFSQTVHFKGSSFLIGAKYQLPVLHQETIPELHRMQLTPEQLWSMRPFKGDILIPVYKLKTGEFSGEVVKLEQDIWNQQLRRDLIHRMVLFTKNLYRTVTNVTLTMDRVSASGIKARPQKGSGRARQGKRQKPGWWKGVLAHGRKARSLRLEMPKKVRLQGLKVTLSAALYDKRIKIIDSEAIETMRTKDLKNMINRLVGDESVMVITGYQTNNNFWTAAGNLQQIQICSPERINVIKLLDTKQILITKEGLEQMSQFLIDRTVNCYTKQKVPLPGHEERKQLNGQSIQPKEQVKYDPTKPLNLKFKVLRDYLQEYEKLKTEGKLEKYVQNMPKTRKHKDLVNSLEK